jgi:hypothetical protein
MTNPLEQTADEALALIWRLRERALADNRNTAVLLFDDAIASLLAAYRVSKPRPLAIAGDME